MVEVETVGLEPFERPFQFLPGARLVAHSGFAGEEDRIQIDPLQSNPHSDFALALAVSGRDIVVVIASSRVSNAISDQERTERYTSIILWATKSSSRSLIASRP